LRYLSVCSGIEAATVAWHPLGWTAAAYSEIEKFPSQVLAHHYPDVPNVGDMTKFKEWNIGSIDLLVGGTPCQSFSVAGLRKGLDDPRGNLMLTYLAIADQHRPRWLVWENVPGVLSSNGGKDFGVFLGALGELGYGFAYRILDAQYFGVAQRRRRVFVVGYLGDWRAAAAVLFERHSLSGDSAPSREKRKEAASGAGDGARVSGLCARTGLSNSVQDAQQGHLLPIALQDITSREKAQNGKGWNADGLAYTVDTHATQGVAQPIPLGYSIREDAKANTFSATELNVSTALKALQPGVQSHHAQTFVAQPIGIFQDSEFGVAHYDNAGTLRAGRIPEHQMVMQSVGAFKPGQSAQAHSIGYEDEMAPTLEAGTGGNNKPAVHVGMAVRRLTPVECERLQGFPDSYTDIQPKGKATPDGPRYKALGNSMAVPVMAWIGKRIQEVENLQCKPNK
jgi:DNA (cytosine-5)-methyltransferase 1